MIICVLHFRVKTIFSLVEVFFFFWMVVMVGLSSHVIVCLVTIRNIISFEGNEKLSGMGRPWQDEVYYQLINIRAN